LRKPNDKLRKALVLLVTWGALLGFFLGYEHYFVDGQREYLIDRDFRNLSRLSAQLNAEFHRATDSVSSLAKIMEREEKPKESEPSKACPPEETDGLCFDALAYAHSYLEEAWDRKTPTPNFLFCLGENAGTIRLDQPKNPSGLYVSVKCPPEQTQSESYLGMDMAVWVRNVFSDYNNTFEDILITDEAGRVLYQQSPTGAHISDLRPILAKGTDVATKQKIFGWPGGTSQESSLAEPAASKSSESSETTGSSKETRPTVPSERLQRLAQGSSATRVTIGGKDYLLFAQPSPVMLSNRADAADQWRLVLVGLRLAAKVDAESHAMPYSILIWLSLCGVVLFGLSWPLFKFQYMSNTERFRPRDGWVLVFTLLLVCSGLTLMLLNASYLRASRIRADQGLKRLACQIKDKFGDEVSLALRQLEQLQTTDEFNDVFTSSKKFRGNYPIEKDAGRSYPYFEVAFWGDDQGKQLAKIDVRQVATPTVDLTGLLFYRAVMSEMKWAQREGGTEPESCLSGSGQDLENCSYFEPILSPNTDEFAPVLAAPFYRWADAEPGSPDHIAVQVLVFRPMSVVGPILPPGYGFAVLDSDCQVLFHSDSFRDMRENFCQESKDPSELRSWLFGGADTALNITYGGRGERAYLTNFPFPGLTSKLPRYLIVFQEGGQQLTLELAVNLVCSILLGFYFVVLVLFACGHLLLRGPLQWDYAPRLVWPCRDFAMQYVQVVCMSLLLCVLYGWFYLTVHEAPLVGMTLGVVFFSTLFAVLRLSSSPDVLFRWGIAFGALALFAWGVLIFLPGHSSSTRESIREWMKPPCMPFAFGLFSVLVSHPWFSLERILKGNQTLIDSLRKRVTNLWELAYCVAVVSLIACGSVIPSAGFFKYAYDAVDEISLKHDEAVLADRLVARRDRIASYYKSLNAPRVAELRLRQTLDRYDTGGADAGLSGNESLFQTWNESDDPPSSLCSSDAPKDQNDFGLNDWIEKQIARATLTFPSNELGSEISRLGLAATDDSAAWERSWTEPHANTFALHWKGPGAPRFSICAAYPEWKGLGTWEHIGLGSFLVVLVLWLFHIAKQIFLGNVESPPPLEVAKWKQVSDIKRDSLVIGLPRSGKTGQLKKLKDLDPRDFRDLREFDNQRSSASRLGELESKDSHSGVIILDQFDFNMRDPAWNEKRLELVAKFLDKTNQKLVLVSTIDPMYFLLEERDTVLCKEDNPQAVALLLERWARTLDRFTRIKLPNEISDDFANETDTYFEKGGESAKFAKWIRDECAFTPMLQKIGVGLLRKFRTSPLPSHDQLVGLVAEPADVYYRMLWNDLTANERLALFQLALDGWANPKNTPTLRQLEQKQLIYRQPMYRIMNDSFRRFIRSSEHQKEILEWQKKEQESTWKILRFVLVAGAIGVGLWLLYAQAQLFQIGAGYITALATLLTAIAGFTARIRRPGPASPPGDGGES
jgi:hypothetical protein